MRNINEQFAPKDAYAAKDTLLRHFLRFGLSIVGEFAWQAPTKIPELVAEMSYLLFWGLELVEKGAIDHHEKPNLDAYLATTIRRGLQKFLYKEKRYHFRYQALGKRMPVARPNGANNLFEILESCIEKPKERQVIEGRLVGLTDEQIGQEMGCTKANVNLIRVTVRKRFLEKLNNVSR